MGGLLLLALLSVGPQRAMVCDADSNWYYRPAGLEGRMPGLVVLSCVGARKVDLDTVADIADSLGWVFGTCAGPRNRRDSRLNDADIVRTATALALSHGADPSRLFVFGFSGMGVQALASLCSHPELLRGAAATCAHRGGTAGANLALLENDKVFLRTRTEDWNRADNQFMYRLLREAGVEATLVTDSGPHSIGPKSELLAACRWLGRATRP